MHSHLTTAFTVSVLTTIVLFFLEWQIPGFVSAVFPLYVPLLMAGLLGTVLLVLSVTPRLPLRPTSLLIPMAALGLMLGVALWPDLVVLGWWRLFFVLALVATPVLLVLYTSYDK